MLSACSTRSSSSISGEGSGAVKPGPASPSAPAPHQSASGQGGGQGFSSGPDGGGASGGGGSLLGGGGYVASGPTVIQSLFDYSQPGLAPWGPVVQSFNVTVGGQTYPVDKLAHYDPFIGKYQLANGDIVMTNEPLEYVVVMYANQSDPPLPPTESWSGPGGSVLVFTNQIQIDFDQTVTEQDIWDLIAEKDLHVIFSSFEPPDPDQPSTNNANAWFWFEYEPAVFANFQAAYSYFIASPHVVEVQPNAVEEYNFDYAQVGLSGLPSDKWYAAGDTTFGGRGSLYQTRHITALGIDTSNRVAMGPPYGGTLSSECCVAVIDSGVMRSHPDFDIPGNPNQRKVAAYCVTCGDNSFFFGKNWGQPPLRDGRLHSRGTQCAGTITATTYDQAHGGQYTGVPACAPRCGVFPIGVRVTSSGKYSGASLGVALAFLKDSLKSGNFQEDFTAVSMSWSDPTRIGFHEKMIIRDLKDSERLYVGSAANLWENNIDGNNLVYPAALPEVLGVSGLWAECSPNNPAVAWFARDSGNNGSNYRLDASFSPSSRAYPVPAVYGIVETRLSNGEPYQAPTGWSRTTSTPVYGLPYQSLYDPIAGTSFACPQVAALGALLFDQAPGKTWEQVRDRIISTRDPNVESLPQISTYQLAGPVRFHTALAPGW